MNKHEHLVRFDMDLWDAYGVSYEILTDEDLNMLYDYIGNVLYLGEISGKHSDVDRELEKSCFEILTDDFYKIEIFKELTGGSIGSFSVINTIKQQLENEE